ncbi:MAG: right-handed parallel beta-helix repeat-containing protein, partial [Hassallia sp.]
MIALKQGPAFHRVISSYDANEELDGGKTLNFTEPRGLEASVLVDAISNSPNPLVDPIQTMNGASSASSTPTPLSIASPGNNSGAAYYVSTNGSDDNPGTSNQPWKTINHAVNKDIVKAGDTILVQPGTYTELITLGKSGNSESGYITLKADGNVTLRDPDPINGGFREGVI